MKSKNGIKRMINIILVSVLIYVALSTYLKVFYPLAYVDLIHKYSKEYNIDPYLIAAIINVESRYDRNAISSKEARGLMQISPITGNWAAEELSIEGFDLEKLFEPEINIRIGSWYLKVLEEEFDGNLQLILAAYNGGSGNVSKWLENEEYSKNGIVLNKIPFKETEEYIEKVEKNINIYRVLYKNSFEDKALNSNINFIALIHNIRKVMKSLILYK
ncbi:lytic transglycosylase domain-containing protein [Tepidimicrobium xylanilyticum]|uniref:Soluble lytic murein transglycosylase n=1 Tax=Tepidimicrobium xylanilyticum TaxID=1123352 RepID=A0A1H3BXI5_9FIRM|nr:lytic transglycosylase domain-containing protein [Tepidimicrobium xylanilyticum]GMG97273.1 transglycosylase SLT domain protein [Tepidimicrobium xylanilyticum]SDX46114.1 soluble lytic murein transglycosylase [Tepidimicrobium xylanilyticum]